MAPEEQEEQCAMLICEYLSEKSGGEWRVDAWLDETNSSELTPDVLLTNGVEDIAIEIKQLTDGAAFDCHYQITRSLYRILCPKTGGEFFLVPPYGILRCLDRKLIRQLKRRIDNAAVHLKVRESTEIEISRQATIRYCGESKFGMVSCSHTYDDVFPVRLQGVGGRYILDDCSGPMHKFITDNCRTAFHRKLEQVCAEIRRKGQNAQSDFRWIEEWELHKTRDTPNDRGGVLVFGMGADFWESAAMESIKSGIVNGKGKFEKRKWARRSAVALHAGKQQREVPPSYFHNALTKFKPADVRPLDLVFLVSEEQVWQFDFAD